MLVIYSNQSGFRSKYKGLVDKKLMQFPEYDHRKSMDRMAKQQEYNRALSDAKTARTQGMTNAQKDMIDAKSKRLQEQNKDGMRTTPSVVYIKGNEMIVGTAAKRKAILEPKNVIFEVKRFIGRQFKELTADDKKVPYEIKA